METPTNMGLTVPERNLFQLFHRSLGRDVEIDSIVKSLDAPSREAATVRIKYFGYKTAQHGWIVTTTSGGGRGMLGTFKMEKRF